MRIRVLTYNIHKGFSTFGSLMLPRIRDSIRSVSADLVFLQEVVGANVRHSRRRPEWPKISPLEYLADEIWPHHAYGRNAVYDEGHHGNAIMSRLPFTAFENIDVSTNRFERRGLLHAEIANDQGPAIHAICVHLDLRERGRARQIDLLAKRIEESVPHASPLIVAGDFNDWRELAGSKIEKILDVEDCHKKLHGEHARTFPSWLPLLRLDRIYVRGLKPVFSTSLEGTPWNELSDHNALYAELET